MNQKFYTCVQNAQHASGNPRRNLHSSWERPQSRAWLLIHRDSFHPVLHSNTANVDSSSCFIYCSAFLHCSYCW